MAAGRPTKYHKDLLPKVREYFASPHLYHDVFPTKEGLAVALGVNKTTIYEWAKKHKEFSNALNSGADQQVRHMTNHLMNREVYSSGAIFVAKNILGWTDKQEVKNETTITGFEVVSEDSGESD